MSKEKDLEELKDAIYEVQTTVPNVLLQGILISVLRGAAKKLVLVESSSKWYWRNVMILSDETNQEGGMVKIGVGYKIYKSPGEFNHEECVLVATGVAHKEISEERMLAYLITGDELGVVADNITQ